jgi:site-specific DNA-methyltransferase (adenine-specific)
VSNPQVFLDGRVTLHAGDCLAVVKMLADNSIDAAISDPPYALVSIAQRFGADDAAPCKPGATGVYQRASAGFMGKTWDTGETAFAVKFWREVFRVLKPGAHVVAFGGTRSYHRLACAIEDAGFEIRDQIGWCYGSGFPKSHNVGLAIDKALGWFDDDEIAAGMCSHAAAILSAEGTALKPAWEPICLARKPLSESTVAANVLRWGTGAINVDGCRVGFAGTEDAAAAAAAAAAASFAAGRARGSVRQSQSIGKESRDGTNAYDPFALAGRWPANIVHDGSAEVLAAFPDVHSAGAARSEPGGGEYGGGKGWGNIGKGVKGFRVGDNSGSAARFFYSAKADSDDRLGSKHPTVKPVDLMRWLCRLVTPPGGTILDPFAGTGTTGEAAWREGFSAVLIEREAEYCADVARRMALAVEGKQTRKRAAAKARLAGRPADFGPLFSGAAGPDHRADQAQAVRAAE